MGHLEVVVMAKPTVMGHQIGKAEPLQAMKPTLTGIRRNHLQLANQRPTATGLYRMMHLETHLEAHRERIAT
jgi:hypothetical protein